jgi:hypothetical protein
LGGRGTEGGGDRGRIVEGAVIIREEAIDIGRAGHTTLGTLKLSWSIPELYIANVGATRSTDSTSKLHTLVVSNRV